MAQLDDVRSPQQKIKPRLLRHIFKPDLSRLSFVPLQHLRPVVNFITKHRVSLSVTVGLGATVWLIFLLVTQLSVIPNKQSKDASAVAAHNRTIKETLTQSDTPLSVDFTFNLHLTINGQPQAIPANYGQSESGKYIFNSTSPNGDIRVQSPEDTAYTLGDFFVLWGGQFNQQCLLNHCSSEPGMLRMTVNDQPNDKFHNYIIQPNDRIVITYGK
jgi:hypothetical protein